MRPSVRAAVPLAVTGAAVVALANPALARPCPDKVEAKGPTYVYDQTFKDVKTKITVRRGDGRTDVLMHSWGYPKEAIGKTFGVHVHVGTCGPKPEDAGPHYQNPDAEPGEDLPVKEIWLDATVGKDGHARYGSNVNWTVAKGAAGSVVLHARATDHHTGDAGARSFCTTVPF